MAILTQENVEISGGFFADDIIPIPSKKFSGIYRLVCTISNKSYIGSSTRCVYRRMSFHRTQLRKNTHHSIKLQRAWNKYGENAFYFHVIEYCLPEECLVKEQNWMDIFQSWTDEGYNVAHLAGKTLGVRRPRTKPHPGHSLETRQLLSKALTGKSKSPLHNIRSGLGHRIPVIQLTLQGEFVKEWACSQEALFSLKYKSNKITSCCKNTPRYQSYMGFKWMYKKDYYGNTTTGSNTH